MSVMQDARSPKSKKRELEGESDGETEVIRIRRKWNPKTLIDITEPSVAITRRQGTCADCKQMRFRKLKVDAFDSWHVVAPHSKGTKWDDKWTCNTNRESSDHTNYCYFIRCTDHLSHNREMTENDPSLAWRYCADDHPTKSNWLKTLKRTKNTDPHYTETVSLIHSISKGTATIGWEKDWVCSDASEHTKYLCPLSDKRKLKCAICKKKREFDVQLDRDWALIAGSEPLVNGTVFEAGPSRKRKMNKWACGSRLMKYRLKGQTEWVSADSIYQKEDGFIENEDNGRGVEFDYCDFHQCTQCGQWRLLDERSTWYKFVHEILRQRGFSEDQIKQKALPHKFFEEKTEQGADVDESTEEATMQVVDMSKWTCTEGMCYIKSSVESLDEPDILYPISESKTDDTGEVEVMCVLCKNERIAPKEILELTQKHGIGFACLFDYDACTGPDTDDEDSDEKAKVDHPVNPKKKRAKLPPGSEVNLFRVRDYTKLDTNEAQKALSSEMTKIKAEWGDNTHGSVSKLIGTFDTKDKTSSYDGLLFWLLLHTTVEGWVHIAVSDYEATKSRWMYYPPGLRLATSDDADPGDDWSSDDEDGGYGEATVGEALETELAARLIVDGVGDWDIRKLREGLLILEPAGNFSRLKLAENNDFAASREQAISQIKKSVLGGVREGKSGILDAAVKQVTKMTNETIREEEEHETKLNAMHSLDGDPMKYVLKYRNPYLALFARNAIFQSMVEETDDETGDESEEETERDEEEDIRVSYLRDMAKSILIYLVGASAGKIAFDALYKLAERGDEFAHLMQSDHVRESELKGADLVEFYEEIRELEPKEANRKMSYEFGFGLDSLITELETSEAGRGSADRKGRFDRNIAKLLTERRDEARAKRRADKIAERGEQAEYDRDEDGGTEEAEEAEEEEEEEEEEEDESEGGLEDLVQQLLIENHIKKEVGESEDVDINELQKKIDDMSGESRTNVSGGRYKLEHALVSKAIETNAGELRKMQLEFDRIKETVLDANDGSDRAIKEEARARAKMKAMTSAYRGSLESEIRKIREANEKERADSEPNEKERAATTTATHRSDREAKDTTVDPWPAKILKDAASSLLADWKNEALDAIKVPDNVTEPAERAALKWNAMRLARDTIARCRVKRFVTGDTLVKTRADGKEAEGKEAEGKEADGKEADGKEADGKKNKEATLEFEVNECAFVPSTLNVEGTFTQWNERSKVSLEEDYGLYAKTSEPLLLIETDNYRYAAMLFAYAKSKHASKKTLGAIIRAYDVYINSPDRDGDPARTMFRHVAEMLAAAKIDVPAWWKYHDDTDPIANPILSWLNTKGNVKWATEAIDVLSKYKPHPSELKADDMAKMLSVIEAVWNNKDPDFDKGLTLRVVSRLVDDIYTRGRLKSMLEYYDENAHEHAMRHIVSLPALVDVDATVGAINRANKRNKERKTSPIIASSYYESDIARKYGFVSQLSLSRLSSLAFQSESESLYAHSALIGSDFIYKCREHTRLLDGIPALEDARALVDELHELFDGSGSIVDNAEDDRHERPENERHERLVKATEILRHARDTFDANLQVPTMMVAYRPGHDKSELNAPGWLLSHSDNALGYIHAAYKRVWKLTIGIKNELEAIKTEREIRTIRGPTKSSISQLKRDKNDRVRELRETTPLAIAWPEQTMIQDLAYGASYKRAIIGTSVSLMSFCGIGVEDDKAACEDHFIDVLIARYAFLRPDFLKQDPVDYADYIARDLVTLVPSDVERMDLSVHLATKITERRRVSGKHADRRPIDIDMPEKNSFNEGELNAYSRILAIRGALTRVKPINRHVTAAALYMFERDDDRAWTDEEKSESRKAILMRRDRIRLLLTNMHTFIQEKEHERVKSAIKNNEMGPMIARASSSFGVMNERQRRALEEQKRKQEAKSVPNETKSVREQELKKNATRSRFEVYVGLLLACVHAVLEAVSILTGATVESVHDELLGMISDARTRQERESDEVKARFNVSNDERKHRIPKKREDQDDQGFGAKKTHDRPKIIDIDFLTEDAEYIDQKVPLELPYYRLADYDDACAAYRRVGAEHAGVYILHGNHEPYMSLLEDLQLGRKSKYKVSDVQARLDKASSAVKKNAQLIVLYFDTTKDRHHQKVLRPATPRVTGTYYCIGKVKVIGSSEFMPSQYQPLNLPPDPPTPVTQGSAAYIKLLCSLAGIKPILDRKKGSAVVTTTQTGLSKLQSALTTASLRLALSSTDRVFFFVIQEDGKLKLDSSTIRDLFDVKDQEVRNVHDIRTARDESSFGMRAFV